MDGNQEVEPIPRCTGAERINYEMEDERLNKMRPQKPAQLSYREQQLASTIVGALFGDR
jgi:hypothetical protein